MDSMQLSQISATNLMNSEQNTQKSAQRAARVLEEHGYTLKKELGQGVFGIAFLVNRKEGDYFVVKQIKYRNKKDLDTVKKEISVLKNLHHGYIVAYEESFEDEDEQFYIVMEYCAGGDLYKKMQSQKEKVMFEEEQILDWLIQICLALQYLHEKHVLHRDIKPQNIFLTEDGYINLGDFGCSKALKSDDTYAKSVVGADLYVSPEVCHQKYGFKSDIWSLGWLLYDLCMLDMWSHPIERRCLHANSMKGTPPKVSDTYSEELQELIKEMLSCDPKDRPSADEILAKPFLKNAVKKNKTIPEALQRKFIKSISTFDEAYNEHYKDLEALVTEWGKKTDLLQETHRNWTIGSLSGTVVGTAGAITALVGVILAPFTLGASLIVTGVGVAVSVAGGAASAASNITDTVKQKSLRKCLEEIEQKYENVSSPILNSLKILRRLLRKLTKFCDLVSDSNFDNVQMTRRIGRSTVACASELVKICLIANLGRIAAQTAKIGRATAAASGVLSGLLVIVDIAFIVKDSLEIHEMRQGNIDDPEKFKSSVLKFIAQMRKTHVDLCNVLKEIKESRDDLKDYIRLARAVASGENVGEDYSGLQLLGSPCQF